MWAAVLNLDQSSGFCHFKGSVGMPDPAALSLSAFTLAHIPGGVCASHTRLQRSLWETARTPPGLRGQAARLWQAQVQAGGGEGRKPSRSVIQANIWQIDAQG